MPHDTTDTPPRRSGDRYLPSLPNGYDITHMVVTGPTGERFELDRSDNDTGWPLAVTIPGRDPLQRTATTLRDALDKVRGIAEQVEAIKAQAALLQAASDALASGEVKPRGRKPKAKPAST